ncbi:DUF1289 domain-containing protein [Photobacterium sp. BZF1]|uniref:DUF1289 domain-containing protein n=1 Tax=Photobacterium sp. BZF1 TaxID=1904457 RepID=UPI001653586F|nr:DUF1289 domain-containing protein [Photobacterium sp. BZF1]MBC7006103.1 DUF1289 domain-containing protein [Photobacterium sp. BZF1]
MKKQKSPCIGLCDFSSSKGWCFGCGRTREESQKWKNMQPYASMVLRKELKKRLSQMNTEQT